MKKNFKEFYKGYSEWCKVGKDHGYGNFLLLILSLFFLPILIAYCYFYYKEGEEHGRTLEIIDSCTRYYNKTHADKMSEENSEDN